MEQRKQKVEVAAVVVTVQETRSDRVGVLLGWHELTTGLLAWAMNVESGLTVLQLMHG